MARQRRISRKEFLRACGRIAAGLAAGRVAGGGHSGDPSRASFIDLAFGSPEPAPGAGKSPLLVTLFLRGGWDGLNVVSPLAGPDRERYEAARPNLRTPLSGPRALLPLDERFGLHPAAMPLFDLYRARKLAFVHAAGLVANTRSHFDAQNLVELGITGNANLPGDGWLARFLRVTAASRPLSSGSVGTGMDVVAIGSQTPTSLLGCEQAITLGAPGGFNLGGNRQTQAKLLESLHRIYQGDHWLERYGAQTLSAMELVERIPREGEDRGASGGIDYPKNELGARLRTLAQMIRRQPGLRAATLDMGGWDTHKEQGGGGEGYLANHLDQLSQSLHAFLADLDGSAPADNLAARTTVVVISEFGRRLRENASRGTDHGHGTVMMVLGGAVKGGRVYGDWPGLATERLYDRADLAVTTDVRQILWEAAYEGNGRGSMAGTLFPGFVPAKKPLGLF